MVFYVYFMKDLCWIPRPLLAGSFAVDSLLYPDLSIESRGTVILREFGPIRNENAAFFWFFRRNVGPGHRGRGTT